MRRLACALLLGATLAIAHDPTLGISCARLPDDLQVAITSGWPPAAPADHVVIATITDLRAERGDASTWGEHLTVRIDAVLRGNLPLATIEIFNPPLGTSGWPDFRIGGQFLIVAHPDASNGGRISTWLCPPNEEITSVERFNQLVALSLDPRISDTAMSPPEPPFGWQQPAGLVLISLAVVFIARRSMSVHDGLHRRDDRPTATDA